MGIKTASRSARRARRKPAPSAATLAGALFSATQQRVLGLLFGQPERSFFATELINLAQAGSGAVQRELERLAESGLVAVTRIGNQKHYQANRAAPIFKELRGIATKALGPAEALRAALAPLAGRVRAAWLYGSVAKGTDRARSDMDVLIVADDLTLEEVYAALKPAEKRLGRPVNPTLYTSKEFERRRAAGNPFLDKVLSGERILLIGGDDGVGATR
jgi:predicted nucleotidyltransferase